MGSKRVCKAGYESLLELSASFACRNLAFGRRAFGIFGLGLSVQSLREMAL